ncbi:MAG TPA: hypothetical protein VF765_21880 [Polyangiaceae bacterium]
MRAFLEMLGSGESLADLEQLAPRLAPGEIHALRAEGFLQPTGTARFEELSIPDVIRTLRALWGAGSGGVRTAAKMSHAPMHLGWFEIDDEPCELVLVADDAHAIAAAARRRERALVLVTTDRAMTPELRRRHGSRARVRFVVLSECLGARDGRICRVDLPVPMASPLPPRAHALPAAAPHSPSARSAQRGAPIFEGAVAWEPLVFMKLDNHRILVRFERRSRVLTAHDLDLARKGSREHRVLFEMLMAFCENDGCLKTRRFGGRDATKATLSRLRKKLKAAFGIEDDPFLEYKPGTGWIARFKVGDGEDERENELSPGARAMLQRAGKLGRR